MRQYRVGANIETERTGKLIRRSHLLGIWRHLQRMRFPLGERGGGGEMREKKEVFQLESKRGRPEFPLKNRPKHFFRSSYDVPQWYFNHSVQTISFSLTPL